MSQSNRVQTMAVKLAAYAQRAGVEPTQLLKAYGMAVAARMPVLGDVFHRELLHPARTALILMEDAVCTNATVLAAAAVTETEHPTLRVDTDRIAETLGGSVASLVAAVPQPAAAGETLLEDLVSADGNVALIAIAERLDHARHLHFRERSCWEPFYHQIMAVYLPFAYRVNQAMAVRVARWADAFEKRLA